MVGVQSLSTTLSIALVVCTGVLVGTLSITTGNELIDDARKQGNVSLDNAIESADKDIRKVVGNYLTAVTVGAEAKIVESFVQAEHILETGANLVSSVTPEEATGYAEDNTFVNVIMRNHLHSNLSRDS